MVALLSAIFGDFATDELFVLQTSNSTATHSTAAQNVAVTRSDGATPGARCGAVFGIMLGAVRDLIHVAMDGEVRRAIDFLAQNVHEFHQIASGSIASGSAGRANSDAGTSELAIQIFAGISGARDGFDAAVDDQLRCPIQLLAGGFHHGILHLTK